MSARIAQKEGVTNMRWLNPFAGLILALILGGIIWFILLRTIFCALGYVTWTQ